MIKSSSYEAIYSTKDLTLQPPNAPSDSVQIPVDSGRVFDICNDCRNKCKFNARNFVCKNQPRLIRCGISSLSHSKRICLYLFFLYFSYFLIVRKNTVPARTLPNFQKQINSYSVTGTRRGGTWEKDVSPPTNDVHPKNKTWAEKLKKFNPAELIN